MSRERRPSNTPDASDAPAEEARGHRPGRAAGDDGDLVDRGAREHYLDAPLYDYEYRRRRRDVTFYRRVAAELCGGPGDVLELACGSGRLTAALLRDGHHVVGLDLSAPMLQRARARLDRMPAAARRRGHLIRADMRRFALGRRVPLVVSAFNSFEHLYTRVDLAACLARVREHLTPGGHLVFDVQNPDLRWLARDPRKRWARTRFRHPVTGEQLVYSTNHDYDPISQIVLIRLYYETADVEPAERRTRVVSLSQRKFFPAELEALVHCNGFRLVARHGDFEGLPLDGECESQVLICRPA
jgi:SAM-dependent methyltransferase